MNNRLFYKILDKVKFFLQRIKNLDNESLAAKTEEFRNRLNAGECIDNILPEAFAVVCETDRRVLGLEPYDCQILGAIALHFGYLAEMNTGEGKTLTATMPLYLNALTGKSTILVTANEYLAVRDAEEMGPVYEFLGMSVRHGISNEPDRKLTNDDKREIYNADIVYTTHGTLGFDYLLNNLVKSAEERYLREFYYVIIDEADMVLLDAANMPLVISGSPRVQSNLYEIADFFVNTLQENRDYIEEEQSVWLTDEGVEYAEKFFGIDEFYAASNFEINRHVTLALKAHVNMIKGKDYVLTDKNEIMLLDSGTGRKLPGMKVRGGLHQAIESKEGITISQETRSIASITFQNLFLMFPHMCGMSGTLSDSRRELRKIYKKKVAMIPPNKPLIRIDKPDKFFKNAEEQYANAINEVLTCHAKGQPVLIVAPTIADTELISKVLIVKQIPHNVLNANNAYWEAQIIREAGQPGNVTVSTGMAGRGTDIKLGEGVKELGGLAVIGIGRMQNTRLERQARGRSGRQGDPGSSQFFVSLEDEVVSSAGEKVLKKYVDENKRISDRKLKSYINGGQKLQEELAVSQRKNAVDYDKVLKRQRTIMYDARNRLLDGITLQKSFVINLVHDQIKSFIDTDNKLEMGDITRFVLSNITFSLDSEIISMEKKSRREIEKVLLELANDAWNIKKQQFADEADFNRYVRICALQSLDEAWIEQVDYLQQLQYAVMSRATAQRSPVFEYHNEAYSAFKRMELDVKRNIVKNIFLSDIEYDNDGKMYVVFA